MPKSTLLLADADPRSLRILELALRKAGFDVVTAADGAQALDRILASPPDLVICDLSLPGKDGVALIRALRGEEKLAGLPLLAMSAEKGREPKARAAEAGADDFVVKPILLKDLVQRVDLLLERRRLAEPDAPAALSGKVSELGLLDLFQSLENWKKSAVVRCDSHGQLARVWVREGEVIDADLGPIHGDAAFWRLMTWESGEFRVEFAAVHREVRVEGGTQGALMEAMRRVDELAQIAEQLPMSTELTLDFGALAARLGDLPDEVNGVVRCFDGKRTLREALDLSPMDDLSTLAVVQRLMGDGILRASAPRPVVRKPSLEKWLSDPPRVPAGLAPPEAERMQETVAQPEKAAGPENPAQAPAPVRPAAAAKPLDVVHFPALRGVRRERLRREADEARTRVAAGQAVRLTHVVELPAFQPDQ